MSLTKGKCWYSNTCWHFLNCAVPLNKQSNPPPHPPKNIFTWSIRHTVQNIDLNKFLDYGHTDLTFTQTLRITTLNDSNTRSTEAYYAECRYEECRRLRVLEPKKRKNPSLERPLQRASFDSAQTSVRRGADAVAVAKTAKAEQFLHTRGQCYKTFLPVN
jgi:hypothetical protein